MAAINTVVQRMVDWIRVQQLTPRPREVVSVAALPPAAFPQVAVEALEEQVEGRAGDFSARLDVTVSYALGRPADAQATARDLAHQLRQALNLSHGLGGAVKSLTVGGIRHTAELLASGEPLVLARSKLRVIVRYSEPRLQQ